MGETEPAAARSRGGRSKELLLLAATLVFCFAVLEVAARALIPAPRPWRWPQVRFQPSASLGFRLVPNQTGFTADQPYSTNAMGLRGPERTLDKPHGVRRVLILGDSIAFGYGVRYEDSVAQKLEGLLNQRRSTERFEVIDSGVQSFNTTQEVTYFREQGIALNPDVVVLAVCWNDVSDKTEVVVNDQGFLVQPDAHPSFFDRFSESPSGYRVRNLLKRSRALYLAMDRGRDLWSRLTERHPPQIVAMQSAVLNGTPHQAVAVGWIEIEKRLIELAALSESHDIRLLVALFPMPQTLDGHYPHARYPSTVLRMCRDHNLQCLDLQPAFEAHYTGHTSLFIPYDGDHPNERGHMIAAQSIYEALRTLEIRDGDLSAGN